MSAIAKFLATGLEIWLNQLLSLLTRYSGLSSEAATWCPLISVGEVSFFFTSPVVLP